MTAPRRRSASPRAPAPLVAAIAFLAAACGCAPPSGTARGKATIAGAPVAGAEIQAFARAGAERSGEPFASVSAGADGTYRIALPPGTYYIVARKTVAQEGRSRTFKGEYPANPVAVTAGGRLAGIDVPLAEMSSGGFTPQAGTAVAGRVTSRGQPAPGAFVYAYPSAAATVRGPSYAAFARTARDGRFRLPLREGSFRVVARQKGGADETGAMGRDGASGDEEGKSVTLAAGETADVGDIALHSPREASRLRRAASGGQERAAAEIRGTVVREDGAPGDGIFVMAYADRRMIGRPFAISGRTGKDGAFVLPLPRAGTFYLGARSGRGGPVAPGEWVGAYDAAADHAVSIAGGEKRGGIRIKVVEKW